MGQRHQIYMRLPAVQYANDNPNNRPEKTIGIHHQWCYGQTALMLLNNFFTFWKNADEYAFTDPYAQKVFELCWSFVPSEGYSHRVHNISDESSIDDPRLGDNNDGITIIDMVGEKPKYCFMSISHIEGKKNPEVKTVLSAEQYLACYYPDYNESKDPEKVEFHEKSRALIESISEFEILSLDRVKEIFPALFKRMKVQA